MSKKVLPGDKDTKGAYLKPDAPDPPPRDPKAIDISIDDLIGKHMLLLYRETRTLLGESAVAKLSRDSSQCLRDNLKLLLELKDREKEIMDGLTAEELEKIAGLSRDRNP